MRFFTLLFSAILFLSAPVYAEMGKSLPTNLELKDEAGQTRSFEDLTGENGAVLVFYRSAKWCPYCKIQVIDLNAQRAAFVEKGYNLVGISYDATEELKKFDDQYKIEFPLLSDEGSKTIKAFGIFNEEHEEGSFAYGVPHPTIYVVSKDKEIKATLAEESYKVRPTVQDVLNALDSE